MQRMLNEYVTLLCLSKKLHLNITPNCYSTEDVARNLYIGIANAYGQYALTALNVNGHHKPQHCICFKSIMIARVGSHKPRHYML